MDTDLIGLNPASLLSPAVVVQKKKMTEKAIFIVRDDLLPGGTKQRACAPFLLDMKDKGFSSFVYASPFSGFAQVALAYVCRELRLNCVLVCEVDRTKRGRAMHPFTELARAHGAEIIPADDLAQAEEMAEEVLAGRDRAMKIPLGFDCAPFRGHLRRQLERCWVQTLAQLPSAPRQIWLPVGSGTLVKTFEQVLPAAIRIQAVNVHVLKPDDRRIRAVARGARVRMFSAGMPFHEPADVRPGVPSNLYYDAKLWKFIHQFGEDGDVWWNVAR